MSSVEALLAFSTTLIVAMTLVTLVVIRTRRSRAKEPDLSQLDERLLRIEQAVDTVAVEVERISEAQRFATRLLGERDRMPVPTQPDPRER